MKNKRVMPSIPENSEATPLVGQKEEAATENPKGQATVLQTVVNLSKTCMGTGCLGLGYAVLQGGLVVYCVGIAGIAAWNIYAVDRLVRCRSYLVQAMGREEDDEEHLGDEPRRGLSRLKRRDPPPEGTSTLGNVAYYAFGLAGLQIMDSLVIILLLGIIISYLSAVISFLSDTPLTAGPLGDAFGVAALMTILSLVPDLGYLSRLSASGLTVLGGTFLVIAGYGLSGFRQTHLPVAPSLPMWPLSSAGLSHFFGVCVFGFGVVPLTFNFQESMKKPHRIVPATAYALSGVALTYILVGVGIAVLFPAVTGEVLHELPSTGWLPTVTRLAMVVVVILTVPLLIVPAGELLEGKFRLPKVLARSGISLVSVVVAVLLPSFVQVLSFVGCACVGFVSFCVPPILHLRLTWILQEGDSMSSVWSIALDIAMLVWGLIATVLGTIYTLG
jgi:amino acid permease